MQVIHGKQNGLYDKLYVEQIVCWKKEALGQIVYRSSGECGQIVCLTNRAFGQILCWTNDALEVLDILYLIKLSFWRNCIWTNGAFGQIELWDKLYVGQTDLSY